jgi:hypothetical protein
VKRPRNPKDKKIRSYERDCRNTVAESGSSARKAIAKRKAGASQAFRKAVKDRIAVTLKAADDAETFDLAIPRAGRRSFRKFPDSPLASVIRMKLNWKPRRGMSSIADDSENLRTAQRRVSRRRAPWA